MRFNPPSCLRFLILAIISAHHVNAQELNSEKDIIYEKPLFDFSYTKPLFDLNNEQVHNSRRHLRFSAMSGYREGVKSTKGTGNFEVNMYKDSGTSRIYMYNLSIEEMVTMGNHNPNRIIYEVKDINKYRYDKSKGPQLEWMRKNAYCFEYLYPIGTLKTIRLIEKEFAHFFQIKFGVQDRLVKALVITRTSDKDKIKSIKTGPSIFSEKGVFSNVPWRAFISFLDNQSGLPPVIDETGYQNNVNLRLRHINWNDIASLKKKLHKYDLDASIKEVKLKMFVISELD